MGGPARTLSLVSDLPSAFPTMGAVWSVEGASSPSLAEALHDEGYLDVQEAFIDGISHPPRREGPAWEDETRQGIENHGDRRPSWAARGGAR